MTSTADADAKLWAEYGTKLKNQIGANLGPNDRFYLAPLTAAGIAAGKNIDESIKNQGVYQVADTLLDLDTPIFMPTRKSYYNLARLYCNSVQLFSNNNPGAVVRYNNAQEAAKIAQDKYMDTQTKALKAWNTAKSDGAIDPKTPFDIYCSNNYPNLAQLQQTAANTAGAAVQAAAAVSGSDAAQVSQYLNALNLANSPTSVAGYTMPCSAASANQIDAKKTGNDLNPYYSPSYNIEASYSDVVDGWIGNFDNKNNTPTTIDFSVSTSQSSNFTQLGFSDTTVSVTGSYDIFFSATFTENNKTVTKNITASQAGSNLECQLTATGMKLFTVNPSQKWNPATLWGMPLVDNADPQLSQPVAYIDQVLMAYGVGLNLKMSSSLQTQIHNYLEQARTTGGSASFFGFNIGLGGSATDTNSSSLSFDDVTSATSGQGISLPPQDNAYPTLLAAIGKQLPAPGSAKQ